MTIDKAKLRASAIDWGHHPMEITGDDMQTLLDEIDQLKAENEALRKDAERWAFFKELSCQIQAFPHAWGKMTPEKMDFMCDAAMAKEVSHD